MRLYGQKYVLTGGPGAGKTTLVNYLASIGEATLAEAAADLIREQMALGIQFPNLEPDFEVNVLKLQLHRELKINPALPRIFLDRGLLDALAYYQLFQKRQSPLMESITQRMKQEKVYMKVFLIEHQGLMKTTSVRTETIKQALLLEKLQEENYKTLGYDVIRIPFDAIKSRIQMLLANL
ncbi:MAG: AAA family ATPase [Chloroflexaceae bacterium]|nr:AAA family ATPase [Chloroflexaceae bacterium]